jgi:hypothetical protein
VPALACDASGQRIPLRCHANAGTELQVESQVITQVDMAQSFVFLLLNLLFIAFDMVAN